MAIDAAVRLVRTSECETEDEETDDVVSDRAGERGEEDPPEIHADSFRTGVLDLTLHACSTNASVNTASPANSVKAEWARSSPLTTKN